MENELHIREAATLVEGGSGDGTFLIHVIRPCVGKGRGSHLYEADMLARDAGVFAGWKMYLDHEDPKARAQRSGLPRSVRELGGRVVESWWDPNVPAEGRFGQGAVMGRVKATPFVRELVENDPEIVGVSINARATAVRPVTRGGQRVNLVEGIAPGGSVDWVTEIGAGGRVASLREAVADEALDGDLIDAMTDDEFMVYVAERRPDLAESFQVSGADEEDDAVGDIAEAKAKAKAAEPDADESGGADDGDGAENGDMVSCPDCGKKALKGGKCPHCGHMVESTIEEDEVTPESIREALQDPGVLGVIESIVQKRVDDAVSEACGRILFEARADYDRTLTLRDLRDQAHKQIEEAGLPEVAKADLKGRFEITGTSVTAALDVFPRFAEDGSVAMSEAAVLSEAVAEEIARVKSLMAAANPTLVEGLGSADAGDSAPKPAPKRNMDAVRAATALR